MSIHKLIYVASRLWSNFYKYPSCQTILLNTLLWRIYRAIFIKTSISVINEDMKDKSCPSAINYKLPPLSLESKIKLAAD